jgi:N-acetylglucosamine kinase-like BadF-type ATPase
MPETSKRKNTARLHNLYLGVDGGGTKTHIASNPLRVGVETAVSNIIAAINSACDSVNKNRGDIVSATIGLAGVRRADLRQIIHERVVERLGVKKIQVFTDAEIALHGVGINKAGLVIIAGTGSVCIGQNAKGETFSAGGWGPLAGDEGGGAGIALNALHKIAKASDGRGEATSLSDVAVDYFRAGRIENLSVALYAPQIDNARIAGFARFVGEAAVEGDQVAVEILREAGYELGTAACAVIKKLGLQRTRVPIGMVGSVFRSGKFVTDSLLQTVHQIAPKAYLLDRLIIPAHSAAQMAYEMNGNGKKKAVKA